jgi:hypothetical protein
MTDRQAAAGFPPDCSLIEVRVSDLNQLFNSFDPTPFQGRDLDPQAEEFIVGWAREVRSNVPLGLLVHVDREAASADADMIVHTAVRDHFERRAKATRQKLRQLFRLGRRSLLIGLAFLATCIVLGDALGTFAPASRFTGIVRESLLIGGWVAMWRPIEVFLYEWWPIRAEAVLSDRLSAMSVRVTSMRAR